MFSPFRAIRAKIRNLTTLAIGQSLSEAFSTIPPEDPEREMVLNEQPFFDEDELPELTDEDPPDLSWLDTPFVQSYRDNEAEEYQEIHWALGDLIGLGEVALWSGHPNEGGSQILIVRSEEDLEGAHVVMRRGVGTFWVTPSDGSDTFFVYP